MTFELSNSFEENLALFKASAEEIDAECAKILFDHLAVLNADGDANPTRATIAAFNQAVQQALDALINPDVDPP